MSDELTKNPEPLPDFEPVQPKDEIVGPKPEFHEILEAKEVEAISKIVRREVVTAISHESHSGPMPSPSQLDKYEKVLPGTAKVIRDEFQANGQHVRELEKAAIHFSKDDNDKNRKVAERLVWGALIASVVTACTGHETVASVLAVSTVGAVVTGFLLGKRQASSATSQQAESED